MASDRKSAGARANRHSSWPLAAVSELEPETASASWEIRSYSLRDKRKDKALKSGAILEAAGARFSVWAYLGGCDDSVDGSSSLWCHREEDTAPAAAPVTAVCTLTVLGKGDKSLSMQSHPVIFAPTLRSATPTEGLFCWWGKNNFVGIRKLESEYVVDDTLVIGLRVTAWGPGQDRLSRLPSAPGMFGSAAAAAAAAGGRKRKRSALAEDLAALLAGERAADVELGGSVAEESGRAVRAHRAVLAARSPVFDRMLLESGMRESEAGAKISLEGVDCRVAELFVRFLYTDELDEKTLDCPDDLCYLLTLAHRYEVQSLIEVCAASVVVTEDTAIDRLIMAERFGLAALKEQAMDFLCSCRRRLAHAQKTEAFARMVKGYPQLLTELFAKATQPNCHA